MYTYFVRYKMTINDKKFHLSTVASFEEPILANAKIKNALEHMCKQMEDTVKEQYPYADITNVDIVMLNFLHRTDEHV